MLSLQKRLHRRGSGLAHGGQESSSEIDIIGIPGIGADPCKTWGETPVTQWLGPKLLDTFGIAQVLLYDHLTDNERLVQEIGLQSLHPTNITNSATVGRVIEGFRIQEWASRLLNELEKTRQDTTRPVIFICHSTGGIVLKEALSRKSSASLAAACLLITNFAVPHHGSSILSHAGWAQHIQSQLSLEWPLGALVRGQLNTGSSYLELLNQKFSFACLGIQIWNYSEEAKTRLRLVEHSHSGITASTNELLQHLVEPHSAEISSIEANVTIEDEEELEFLPTNHQGTARLLEHDKLYDDYIEDIKALIASTSAKDRRDHQTLLQTILGKVMVDTRKFYPGTVNDVPTLSVELASRSLIDFFDEGMRPNCESVSEDPRFQLQQAQNFRPDTTSALASSPAIIIDVAPDSIPSIIEPLGSGGEDVTRDQALGRTPRPKIGERSPSRGRRALQTSRFDIPNPEHSRSRSRRASRQYDTAEAQSIATSVEQSERDAQRGPDLVISHPTTEQAFTWYHVPFCVSGWVPQVLIHISHIVGLPNLHKRVLTKQFWMTHHNRSRHSSFHSRYVHPNFQTLPPAAPRSPSPDRGPKQLSPEEDIQFALFLPFLHWDTFSCLEARASIIKARNAQDIRPISEEVLTHNNVEHQVIWQYLNSTSPMHCRRSLDQFGYPSLRNTEARDKDQVLYKKTRGQIQPPTGKSNVGNKFGHRRHASRVKGTQAKNVTTRDPNPATVLTVDTLWLWILTNDTLVTFASKRQEHRFDNEKLKYGTDHYENILSSAGHEHSGVKDCFDLAALVVSQCVVTLLEEAEHPNLQIFEIFEEYISELTEAQTNSFKTFRDEQDLAPTDHHHTNADDAKDVYASRKDLYNLLELRDISDELGTIKKLLTEQQTQVSAMQKSFTERLAPQSRGLKGIAILEDTTRTLNSYVHLVNSMLDSSEAAQKSYEKLLELKSAQANVDEAHAARKQTEVSTEQTRAVTIFTIVTIIFSPLSFFASIFGMNVEEWQGENTYLDLYFVLKIIGCVSLAVIILALLAAFNRLTRNTFMRWARWVHGMRIWPWLRQLVLKTVKQYKAWNKKKPSHLSAPNSDEEKGRTTIATNGIRGKSPFMGSLKPRSKEPMPIPTLAPTVEPRRGLTVTAGK